MISRELLSEVLGLKIKKVVTDDKEIKTYLCGSAYKHDIAYFSNDWGLINIYELAHKCKEWALGKDFVLYSGSTHRTKGYRCDIYTKDGDIDEDFVGDTEPEAIFKTCEWIMEQEKGA